MYERTIRINKFPKEKEFELTLHLEDRRNNGGDVKEVRPSNNYVDVEFEDKKVARNFVKVGFITVDGIKYNIVSTKEKVTSSNEIGNTIQITGLNPSVSEESLLMYLENMSQCFNDVISFLTFNSKEGYATCLIENQEVVKKICQKEDHNVLLCSLNIVEIPEDVGDFHKLSSAIKVTMTSHLDEWRLTLCFENPRMYQGVAVENIFYSEGGQMAVITFERSDTVQLILQESDKGPIIFENAELYIEKMEPLFSPVSCGVDVLAECLIVKNLPLSFKNDELLEYFKKHLEYCEISEILFTRSHPGTSMVIFKSSIDFHTMQRIVYSKPFRDKMLGIEQVKKSKSIQVFNIGNISPYSIENYFTGSFFCHPKIEKRFFGENHAILTFVEPSSVGIITSKTNHSIDGIQLCVEAYYEEIGLVIPQPDSLSCACWFPQCLVVQCEAGIVLFLLKCEESKRSFELKLLRHCWAIIEWPMHLLDFEKNSKLVELRIKFSKTDDSNPINFDKLASWEKDCKQLFKEIKQNLSTAKMQLLQEVWFHIFPEFFRSLGQPAQSEKVGDVELSLYKHLLIVGYSKCYLVTFNGLKDEVDKCVELIERLKLEEEAKLNRVKLMITEELSFIRTQHIDYLRKINYFDSQIDTKNVEVIDNFISDGKIILKGLPDDIIQSKLNIHEFIATVTKKKVNMEEFVVELLKTRKEFKNHIEEIFSSKKLKLSWSLNPPNQIIFYSSDNSEIDEATTLLKSEFIKKEMVLEENKCQSLQLPQWKEMKKEMIGFQPLVVIQEGESKIILMGTRDGINNVLELINSYFNEHAINETHMTLQKGQFLYIQKYKKHHIDEMQGKMKLSKSSVKIIPDHANFKYHVKGTQSSLQSVLENIKQISEQIMSSKTTISKLGFDKYIKSKDGTKALESIEASTSTHIEIGDGDGIDVVKITGPGNKKWVTAAVNKNVTIEIVMGSILDSDADIIVNAANNRLSHVGGVAKAISDAAGYKVQEECSQHVTKHGQLKVGEVFISSPGKLKFQAILHAVGPIYRGGSSNEKEQLYSLMQNILKIADKNKWHKVALPAISTGVFGFPLVMAAECIVGSIVDFAQYSKDTLMIQIVDVKFEVMKEFKSCIVKKFPSSDINFSKEIEANQESTNISSRYRANETTDTTPHTQPMKLASSLSSNHPPLKFVKGSLVEQKVDVIVNSASSDLNLENGTVAKLIAQKAGPLLQQECQEYISRNGSLRIGQVFASLGHSLQCKYVFHGVCSSWASGGDICEQSIRALTHGSLKEASRQNLKSIAMPAFGTGNLRVPPMKVAKWMYDETTKFFEQNSGSSLTDLRLVVYDKDLTTIWGFEEFLSGKSPTERTQERKLAYSSSWASFSSKQKPQNELENGFAIDIEKIVLEVCQGDLTNEATDAIVNSTNSRFDFSIGRVAQVISRKGGSTIAEECKKLGKLETLAVTKAGNLPCKYIFHVITSKDFNVVRLCLLEAEKRSLNTLSFPMLGTGNIGISVSEVAKELFKIIVEFAKSGPKFLAKVRIVIFESDKFKEFKKAMENENSLGFMDKLKNLFVSEPKNSLNVQEYVSPKAKSETVFCIYALSQKDICDAQKELEGLAKDAVGEKIIKSPWEEVISELKEIEVRRIRSLVETHPVEIVIGKAQGTITLRGDKKSMHEIYSTIVNLLTEVEERLSLQKEAKNISKQVQWLYKDKDYDKYPEEISAVIEKAYISKKEKVSWNEEEGESYEINFKKMVEICSKDPSVEHIVKRMTSDNKYPITWDHMKPEQDLQTFVVARESKEYKKVKHNVSISCGKVVNNILKIERIQNTRLFKEYSIKKEDMIKTHRSTNINIEQVVWHAAPSNFIDSIQEEGFNRSRNVMMGKASPLGRGSYFSASFADAVTSSGQKCVFQCLVLVGEYTMGTSSLKDVPRDDQGNKYDSVVDNPKQPATFVVFNDAQAYPEYLISFN